VLMQPAQSVELLVIPDRGVTDYDDSSAVVADAYVGDGAHRGTYFGDADQLLVRASASDPDQRFVSYIQTKLPHGWTPSEVDMAVLRVTGRSGTSATAGSGDAVVHVYGIDNDDWARRGERIHWTTAPNLPDTRSMTSVDTIAANFLRSVGTNVHILGSITGNSGGVSDERIDVTDYVRAQKDGVASFMLIREVRYEADESTGRPADVDAANASFWMASLESTTAAYRPKLELVRTVAHERLKR
jgi:hypothetical protein